MESKSTSASEANGNNQRDKSKIYFFIIAVAALLLTNVYFYVKSKSSGEKLYTVALQKEELQREIDRAEAELDNIANEDLSGFPVSFVNEEKAARKTISDLRLRLDDVNINEQQIVEAKSVIERLKNRVSVLKEETSEIQLQNELLKKENELLSNQVTEKTSQVKVLEESNSDLNKKVLTASSIKVSNISVNGVDQDRKDNYEIESKAKRVDKLQIKFTIADNILAKEGPKDVFVRVIDPQGNLIANNANIFNIQGGNKLQYTFKEQIKFTNKGEEYEFLWSDSDKFKKGAYTVLLYADSAIMGRSSVVLK